MSKHQLERAAVSYDADFYEWCLETADLIRQKRFDEVDLEHVAEEIEDMGKRDKREVRSRLVVLLAHLLKWQHQPLLRESSTWRSTIVEQRSELSLVLDDSPSLRRIVQGDLAEAYKRAVKVAAAETRIPAKRFPAQCPYSFSETIDYGFFPDAAE